MFFLIFNLAGLFNSNMTSNIYSKDMCGKGI